MNENVNYQQLKHINREKHLDYFVLLNNQDHERPV